MRIPQGATLASALAVEAGADSPSTLGVAFRVGISDGRTYEQLLDRTVLAGDSPAWQAVELDLKRYAGWQWSLFYRPSSLAWEIVLNAYPTAPTSPDSLRALWATPQINGAGR
ncbi:MAG: hypothetical protein ABI051_15095 [Vicinamibacterales bacterium]